MVAAAFLETQPRAPTPAPNPVRHVVEIRNRLVHRLLRLHLRNLNAGRTQIQVVADQVRMPRMLDPKLHVDANLRRHLAESDQGLLVERGVLAVRAHEVIRPRRDDVLETPPRYFGRDAYPKQMLPRMNSLLQRECARPRWFHSAIPSHKSHERHLANIVRCLRYQV